MLTGLMTCHPKPWTKFFTVTHHPHPPHCSPMCQPQQGHRYVSPYPPSMRRTCSCMVGRELFEVIGLARVTGRTRCTLCLLSQVSNCPGFSPASLVPWETFQSLKIGIVVCPASEKLQTSLFSGRIQSSILRQNKGVAPISF